MTSTTLAFLHGVILQAGPERHIYVARDDGENPDVLDTTFYVTQHNAPRSSSCVSGNVICEAASRVLSDHPPRTDSPLDHAHPAAAVMAE
jgi:hypothetical protein